MGIHGVCVFCGSSLGTSPLFSEAAAELGRAIVCQNWQLVYGGGSVGLMGVLADTVLAAGGRVVGVIPRMLATRELLHAGLSELHVVDSMHARKALMAERADAFIALPGGLGTFEELLEIITWAQLGLHQKPIGLLNVAGYYLSLLQLFDRARDAGFMRAEQRELMFSAETVPELISRLPERRPSAVPQWIAKDQT